MIGLFSACFLAALMSQMVAADLDTSPRLESEDGFTRMSRSNDGPSPVWTIQQQPESCGVVWFSQNDGAMSQYDMLDIRGAEGCAGSSDGVWAGMFQVEESVVAQFVFESVCNGDMDLSWLPSHLRAEMTGDDALGGFRPTTLDADATTFMIIRNTCPNPVNVIVSQAVALNFVVHVSTLMRWCKDAVTVLLVVAGVLACFLCFVGMKMACALCSSDDTDDEEQSRDFDSTPYITTSSVVSKLFRIRSSGDSSGDADDLIHTQYQPLLSAKDAAL